jgi:hypothetical protein
MTRTLLATAVFAGLALFGPGASRARAEQHPRMHAALFEMRQAATELKEASHDFGGHRAKALSALEAAIDQSEKALKAVGEDVKGIEPRKEVYKAYANHPHIRQAAVELREARDELKAAPHDFKGHREKAVQALDAAVNQLDAALKFAK